MDCAAVYTWSCRRLYERPADGGSGRGSAGNGVFVRPAGRYTGHQYEQRAAEKCTGSADRESKRQLWPDL